MTKLALAFLAFATLTTGCASMGTKRGQGSQIQKTQTEEASRPVVNEGALEGRAELGER